MALIFAQKDHYEVNSNQELLAQVKKMTDAEFHSRFLAKNWFPNIAVVDVLLIMLSVLLDLEDSTEEAWSARRQIWTWSEMKWLKVGF